MCVIVVVYLAVCPGHACANIPARLSLSLTCASPWDTSVPATALLGSMQNHVARVLSVPPVRIDIEVKRNLNVRETVQSAPNRIKYV